MFIITELVLSFLPAWKAKSSLAFLNFSNKMSYLTTDPESNCPHLPPGSSSLLEELRAALILAPAVKLGLMDTGDQTVTQLTEGVQWPAVCCSKCVRRAFLSLLELELGCSPSRWPLCHPPPCKSIEDSRVALMSKNLFPSARENQNCSLF